MLKFRLLFYILFVHFGQVLLNAKITKRVTVLESQLATFICQLPDHENPNLFKVLWLSPKYIPITLRSKIVIDDARISVKRIYPNEWQLSLKNVSVSDAGDYTCVLNNVGQHRQIFSLVVNFVPRIDEMTSSKQQIYANIGTTVNLFCNVTGNPIPTIKWLKMTNINLYNEFKIDTMSILLKNVQKSDSNFYKCVASNEIKKNVYRLIELIVQYPPDVQLLNSRIGQQQGKTSILKCNIDAVPVPFSVYWEKNDVTLSNDERFKIETTTFENKIILMITINNVQIDDFGFYSCIASNKLGTSLDVVTLYEILKIVTTQIYHTNKDVDFTNSLIYSHNRSTTIKPVHKNDKISSTNLFKNDYFTPKYTIFLILTVIVLIV